MSRTDRSRETGSTLVVTKNGVVNSWKWGMTANESRVSFGVIKILQFIGMMVAQLYDNSKIPLN